jgi:isopropylmalate/homocitrate/citramalate synthase
VAALTHLLGVEHGIDPTALASLGTAVERFSGVHTGPLKPVTGYNVFRHESGIHVDAMIKELRSYEFLPAAWLGRRNEFVLGKHSGAANIRHLLRQYDVPLDDDQVRSLLADCKDSAARRSKHGHDRAFTAKAAFAAAALSGVDGSDLLAGAADSLPASESSAVYATTLVT